MSPITKIVKRTGLIVDFDQERITNAIWKAFKAVGQTNKKLSQQISNQVCAVLEVFFKEGEKLP